MVVQYVLLRLFPASVLSACHACLTCLYSYIAALSACPVPVCFFDMTLVFVFYLPIFPSTRFAWSPILYLPIMDVIWLFSCFLHAPWFILSYMLCIHTFLVYIACFDADMHCASIFMLGTSFLCNNFHTFCFYAPRLSIPATCSFLKLDRMHASFFCGLQYTDGNLFF